MNLKLTKRHHPLVIVTDTREQLPFKFRLYPSVTHCLQTGDYSICGYEHLVTVERKSLIDLVGVIGNGRDRFVRELERMRAYKYKAIVIEGRWSDVWNETWKYQHPASRITNTQIIGSLIAFAARYNILPIMGENRTLAAQLTEKYLELIHKDILRNPWPKARTGHAWRRWRATRKLLNGKGGM